MTGSESLSNNTLLEVTLHDQLLDMTSLREIDVFFHSCARALDLNISVVTSNNAQALLSALALSSDAFERQ